MWLEYMTNYICNGLTCILTHVSTILLLGGGTCFFTVSLFVIKIFVIFVLVKSAYLLHTYKAFLDPGYFFGLK